MNFFGYTKRHDSLERKIFKGIIEGRMGRGRPKKRWSQEISERKNMNVTEDAAPRTGMPTEELSMTPRSICHLKEEFLIYFYYFEKIDLNFKIG